MNINQLKKLRKFKIGSWALWRKDKKINYFKYFKTNINHLHGKVIFLGLNRSRRKGNVNIYTNAKYEFQNFQNVKRLRNCIRGKYLKGSYITDFYRKDINPNSNDLKNKTFRQKRLALNLFFKQIKVFNLKPKNLFIIAFGDMAFNHLIESLKWNKDKVKPITLKKSIIEKINIRAIYGKYNDYEIKIFRVYHYSQNNRGGKYELKLKEQLRYLNKNYNRFINS